MTNRPPNYRESKCCANCRYGMYINPEDNSVTWCDKYKEPIFCLDFCDEWEKYESNLESSTYIDKLCGKCAEKDE